jgi:hypothetical protein
MNTYSKQCPPQGFYVYAYIRKSDNTPYYIGKGNGARAWGKHHFKIPLNNSQIIILEAGLTEIGAFALERRMIQWYGRKDNYTGILSNKTDGGEGSVGLKMSDEAKRKISLSKIGRKASKETKRKMAEAKLGKTSPHKGCIRSIETRLKQSASLLGKLKKKRIKE